MKKINVLLVIGLFSMIILTALTAYAARQGATSDSNAKVWIMAPRGYEQVSNSAAVDKDYMAIEPVADVTAYFGTASDETFTIEAGRIFPVHHSVDLTLVTSTWCIVY